MNILFLSTIFPDATHPTRGTFNHALCRSLVREHSVRVIAPRPWTEIVRSAVAGRPLAPAAGEAFPVTRPCYWYTPRMLHAEFGQFLWASIRRRVRETVKRERPDAVLSYWTHPDGEAGLRAARLAGVSHAVIVGGTDVLLLPRDPRRGARVRRVLRQSDAVMTVSESLREAVIGLGVDPSRVHTVYQGIDAERFHAGDQRRARQALGLPSARTLLLWVGRMVEVKGLNVLLEACVELRDRGRDFELCLAGEGPLRPALERQVRDAGLDDRVRFVGPVPHDALPDWYRAADVTVLSSWSEGLPNVLRESLACGTPFVSTDVGSVREIAVEGCSRLADAGDPLGLADAIGTTLGGDFRRAARDYRARTWEVCARQTASVLQNCRHGTRESPRSGSGVHSSVLPDTRTARGNRSSTGKSEMWTLDPCVTK